MHIQIDVNTHIHTYLYIIYTKNTYIHTHDMLYISTGAHKDFYQLLTSTRQRQPRGEVRVTLCNTQKAKTRAPCLVSQETKRPF